MTISEEKKAKIFELYEKGLSKKEISRTVQISYTSIQSILKKGDTEQIQERKKEIVEEKLIEIFRYEGYTEETIVNLVFNLKRIGENYGRDLGQFIEDLEYILDIYQKNSDNPIKLFDFFLDVSDNQALICDHIEPEALLKAVDIYIEHLLYLNEIEAKISEIKQKSNELVDSKAIELRDLDRQIEEYRTKTIEMYGGYSTAIEKFLNKPELKEAKKKIAVLQLGNQILIKKCLIAETELKKTDKEKEEAERENLLYKTLIEKLKKKYPKELNETIKEVDVKNDKQKTNTNKEENREKEN